jgi:GTP-binding protein HflX
VKAKSGSEYHMANGALLASVQTQGMSDEENSASLDELERLLESLGAEACGRVSQKKQGYGSSMVFGEGKLIEMANTVIELKAAGTLVNQVVFDRELSPLQSRNVEQTINNRLAELKCDHEVHVSDRTGIIIEIFSRHAKTRQSRLQIEMARLKYTAPRLRDQLEYHGDRQAGGIGAKGVGETALELKRRQLRDRLAELRRELQDLESENETRREKRETQAVAIVGYTNAGKSSLMRGLTGSDVYVADKLFATLDVTTRQMHPPVVPPILVTDTVGFVRFLPHDLVASFKSSLAEVNHADFLLHVIDAADPQFRIQMQATEDVLKELGAEHQDRKTVFNKIDKLNADQIAMFEKEFPDAWYVSAVVPAQITELRNKIIRHFEQGQKRIHAVVPFTEAKLVGEIHRVATVVSEKYDESGTILDFHVRSVDLDRLRSHFPRVLFEERQSK